MLNIEAVTTFERPDWSRILWWVMMLSGLAVAGVAFLFGIILMSVATHGTYPSGEAFGVYDTVCLIWLALLSWFGCVLPLCWVIADEIESL